MKNKILKSEILDEILSSSPKTQAVEINRIHSSFIPKICALIYKKGKKEFLKFLSKKTLVVILDELFSDFRRRREDTDEFKISYLKDLVKLPNFEFAWKAVYKKHKPGYLFSFVPDELLLESVFSMAPSYIETGLTYKKLAVLISEGTYEESMISVSGDEWADSEVKKSEAKIKRYKDLSGYSSQFSDHVGAWMVQLLEVLSCEDKILKLYNKNIDFKKIEKILYACSLENNHISDARFNDRPYALAFLSWNSSMESKSLDFDESVRNAVSKANIEFAEILIKHTKKLGISRVSEILSIGNFFDSESIVEVIELLPAATIKQLLCLSQNKWIRSYLTDDQKIAISKSGSISASDAKNIISSDEKELSVVTLKKIKNMPLKDKLILAADF